MKNINLKMIFAAVAMALSIAVVVILFLNKDADLRSMLLLCALGMAAQSLAMLDKMGEDKEK